MKFQTMGYNLTVWQ